MSAEPTPGAPRRDWRRHPLLKRLPLLLLVVLGLTLWDRSKVPERELVWRLEGPGWARVSGLELQVLGEGDEVLKREERFFPGAPPSELVVPLALREGAYRVRFFLRTPEGTLPARVESLTVGDAPRVEQPLWLSARR
ncbi:MAG TPA: hypothetical protein VFO83_06935 [Aggregicoccus sp.]|nr:hypothetical protein [Aggregicoccus sp.]